MPAISIEAQGSTFLALPSGSTTPEYHDIDTGVAMSGSWIALDVNSILALMDREGRQKW
jgi:hypothetical protein